MERVLLVAQLARLEPFSDRWMQVWRQIRQIDEGY